MLKMEMGTKCHLSVVYVDNWDVLYTTCGDPAERVLDIMGYVTPGVRIDVFLCFVNTYPVWLPFKIWPILCFFFDLTQSFVFSWYADLEWMKKDANEHGYVDDPLIHLQLDFSIWTQRVGYLAFVHDEWSGSWEL